MNLLLQGNCGLATQDCGHRGPSEIQISVSSHRSRVWEPRELSAHVFTRAGSERLATWNPHSGPTAVNKSSSYKGGRNSDEVMAKKTLFPPKDPMEHTSSFSPQGRTRKDAARRGRCLTLRSAGPEWAQRQRLIYFAEKIRALQGNWAGLALSEVCRWAWSFSSPGLVSSQSSSIYSTNMYSIWLYPGFDLGIQLQMIQT